MAIKIFTQDRHNLFMEKAFSQALCAYRHNEVPVGALVVSISGDILARAYNKVEKQGCQTGHAEVLAIQRACKRLGGWRLPGCWLYVTLEPCAMCLGLVALSRLEGVVYGATSHIYNDRILEKYEYKIRDKIKVISGIKEKMCTDILKLFFREKRREER
jgi:tRNA(adenine34) deaminase